MNPHAATAPARLSMTQVLLCGAAIVTLSMGIRHGFGLFLQPITMDRGWSRETFAFALAIQNLAWGLAGPLAGMVADRYGAFRVLLVGGLLYAGGLVLMALSTSGLAFTGSAGLLLGMAQAGTTYAVIFGVIARNVAPEKRSWAMGVAAAAGSFGQFLMVPVENWLIGGWGWQNALFVLGLMALAILPLAFGLREPPRAASAAGPQQSVARRCARPSAYPSFRLLTAGYFVCGFQVVFIGVHMPSYLKDQGLEPGRGHHGAGADRPVQRLRHLRRRQPGPALCPSRTSCRPSTCCARWSSWSSCACRSRPGACTCSPRRWACCGCPPCRRPTRWWRRSSACSTCRCSAASSSSATSSAPSSAPGSAAGCTRSRGSYDVVWWISVALGVFAALINLPVRETPIVRPRRSRA